MKYAIEVKDVWKKFRLFHDHAPTLKEKVLFRNRSGYEDLWVLKGINLQIEPGKTVGLIGQNGSGKSTLLKLMTRIIYPDRGQIRMKGKVSSLLELGAGFHPDFTGLENIYMNAAIFGMTRKQIDQRIDEIIEFSELGDFIYSPVRIYSSGMYMRLAFSIAINVDPDILLIDEILAVGDESFQKKCFNKMQEFKAKGITMVIVSHSLNDMSKICNEIVWLQNGRIVLDGEPDYVIDQYRNELFAEQMPQTDLKNKCAIVPARTNLPEVSNEKVQDLGGLQGVGVSPNRWGNGKAEIFGVRLINSQEKPSTVFTYGENITIEYNYKVNETVENAVFGLGIFLPDGTRCYGTNSTLAQLEYPLLKAGTEGIVRMRLSHLNLIDGEYKINVAIHDKDGVAFDYHHRLYSFQVWSNCKDIGIVRPQIAWNIEH